MFSKPVNNRPFLLLISALLFLMFLPGVIAAQITIEGSVIDNKTAEPVPGVNVYLANTTFGAATNKNGYYKFTISGDQEGVYNLVFSFIGYDKKIVLLQLSSPSKTTVNAKLELKTQLLKEIEVTSSNKKWKRNYAFFAKQFLGQTEFSKKTSIENPWVIDFKKEKRTRNLIASAQKPLIIINNALGYQLEAELVEFNWDRRNTLRGIYQIYPLYKELEPNNYAQRMEWAKNRFRAYLGSLPHFLKALVTDSLSENHFGVDHRSYIKKLSDGETRLALLSKYGLSTKIANDFTGYKVKQKIEVSYKHVAKFTYDGSTTTIPIFTRSYFEARFDNKTIFVHKSGKLLNPTSITVYDAWARTRVASSLPRNYSPDH